jgi:hypothetical protein
MNNMQNMEHHFNIGDKVEYLKNGHTGVVSRIKVLGMGICCGIQVTWDDPLRIRKIFQKHEHDQLKKL